MRVYFFTLAILFSSACFSQERNESFSQGVNSFVSSNIRPNGSGIMVKGEPESGIDGDPYLFNNWNNFATILIAGGKNFNISNLNYDTKLDRFVYKVALDSVFIFEPSNLKEVLVNKKKFKTYEVNGIQQYFEIVATGKGKEILKKNIKKVKKSKRDPFTGKKKNDRYVLVETYYLNSKEGMNELKLRKKDFIKVFGNKIVLMKKFIKKNKLSIKKDVDISKIFKYYNSL